MYLSVHNVWADSSQKLVVFWLCSLFEFKCWKEKPGHNGNSSLGLGGSSAPAAARAAQPAPEKTFSGHRAGKLSLRMQTLNPGVSFQQGSDETDP